MAFTSMHFILVLRVLSCKRKPKRDSMDIQKIVEFCKNSGGCLLCISHALQGGDSLPDRPGLSENFIKSCQRSQTGRNHAQQFGPVDVVRATGVHQIVPGSFSCKVSWILSSAIASPETKIMVGGVESTTHTFFVVPPAEYRIRWYHR